MGNTIGRRRRAAKVMKVDGETFKLKTPARASDVVKDYPGYVLLDSEDIKSFGITAKPLEPEQELKPKRIYFLLELPKLHYPEKGRLTRVRSNSFHVSAKEKLEMLMLSRRSASDISFARGRPMSTSDVIVNGPVNGLGLSYGPTTVKLRLPKAQLEKIMEESHDRREVIEKVVKMYSGIDGGSGTPAEGHSGILVHPDAPWTEEGDGNRKQQKAREKRVSFFEA